MAGTPLATAWVAIVPETTKVAAGVREALGQAEKVAAASGKNIGSKLGATLKLTAASAGAAAGGALAIAMAKGMGRLNAIDEAQAKLKGLGNSAETVQTVMTNALASVKGTAYGLGEAASTAAGLVAAGIKPGEQLETTLKTVADTAAIAGSNVGEIGVIFGSVAARGKLQGDDMLQLLSRGVPVLQLLAAETGKTSAEISDMVSKGQVDFATFERAMRAGMGGAALAMGDTFKGAIANLQSALGRLGAEIQGPLFAAVPKLATGATAVVDAITSGIKPGFAALTQGSTDVATRINQILVNDVAPAAGKAATQVGNAIAKGLEWLQKPENIEKFKTVMAQLVDVMHQVGPAAGEALVPLLQITQQISADAWQALVDILNAAAPVIRDILVPALEKLAEEMKEHPGLVRGIVTAWLGAKAISAVAGPIGKIGGAISKLGKIIGNGKAVNGLLKIATIIDGKFPALAGKLLTVGGTFEKLGSKAASAGGLISKIGVIAVNPLRLVGTVLAQVGSKLLAFLGPWGMVAAAVATAGAALWGFFTKTETGRAILDSFTAKLQEFGSWLGGVFASAWDTVVAAWNSVWSNISGAVSGFVQGIYDALLWVVAAVIAPWKIMWEAGLFQPVVNAVNTVKGWLESFKAWAGSVWDGISERWQAAIAIIGGIFQAVGATISNWWHGITDPIFNLARAAFDKISAAWSAGVALIKGALSAAGGAISGWWTANVSPILEAVKNGVKAMVDKVSSFISTGFNAAVAAATAVFNSLKSKVTAIVDSIKQIWNDLKSALSAPINIFVNATRRVHDELAGEHRANGGAIYGPGTGTSDSIPAWLSNGEHVLTAEEVRKAGGQAAIYRLRAAIRAGKAPRFALGGAVGGFTSTAATSASVIALDMSKSTESMNSFNNELSSFNDNAGAASSTTANAAGQIAGMLKAYDPTGITGAIQQLIAVQEKYQQSQEAIAQRAQAVTAAEEALAQARQAEAQAIQEAGVKSQTTMAALHAAEAALAQARRSGNPIQIEQAEARLAQARLNAANASQKSVAAADKVAEAERKLQQAREQQAVAGDTAVIPGILQMIGLASTLSGVIGQVQAAIAALQIAWKTAKTVWGWAKKAWNKVKSWFGKGEKESEAISDTAQTVTKTAEVTYTKLTEYISALADMGKLAADLVDKTKKAYQEVTRAYLSIVSAAMDFAKAQAELTQTRIDGALSVFKAEQKVREAMAAAAGTQIGFQTAISENLRGNLIEATDQFQQMAKTSGLAWNAAQGANLELLKGVNLIGAQIDSQGRLILANGQVIQLNEQQIKQLKDMGLINGNNINLIKAVAQGQTGLLNGANAIDLAFQNMLGDTGRLNADAALYISKQQVMSNNSIALNRQFGNILGTTANGVYQVTGKINNTSQAALIFNDYLAVSQSRLNTLSRNFVQDQQGNWHNMNQLSQAQKDAISAQLALEREKLTALNNQAAAVAKVKKAAVDMITSVQVAAAKSQAAQATAKAAKAAVTYAYGLTDKEWQIIVQVAKNYAAQGKLKNQIANDADYKEWVRRGTLLRNPDSGNFIERKLYRSPEYRKKIIEQQEAFYNNYQPFKEQQALAAAIQPILKDWYTIMGKLIDKGGGDIVQALNDAAGGKRSQEALLSFLEAKTITSRDKTEADYKADATAADAAAASATFAGEVTKLDIDLALQDFQDKITGALNLSAITEAIATADPNDKLNELLISFNTVKTDTAKQQGYVFQIKTFLEDIKAGASKNGLLPSKPITINLTGDAFSVDDVENLIDSLTSQVAGLDVRLNRMEQPGYTGSQYAREKRALNV